MSDHLRLAGADPARQLQALSDIIRATPLLMAVLAGLRELGLSDPLLVSGAIYNSVWNHLTGRPLLVGIKDVDVVYCDDGDLSYAAEDRVIRRARVQFSGAAVPVEVRNQARVHLWFPQKFGMAYPQLKSSAEMLDYFATKTYAVGVRLEPDDRLSIFAPYGLDDMFSFRLTPNTLLHNRLTHEAKAARVVSIWPGLTLVPWPDGA
ncbi:nucleotidyltransferase family protein [Devosia sp.]|uniref:nucleotidyltransferase family protein n=1 Tax=Devosia sp. TaxID=1871048 RepID=UPI0032678EDC